MAAVGSEADDSRSAEDDNSLKPGTRNQIRLMKEEWIEAATLMHLNEINRKIDKLTMSVLTAMY